MNLRKLTLAVMTYLFFYFSGIVAAYYGLFGTINTLWAYGLGSIALVAIGTHCWNLYEEETTK